MTITSDQTANTQTHFWLRAEIKELEKRTPLLPSQAQHLLRSGFKITVERSPERCCPDSAYEAAGCTMVSAGTWPDAPLDAIILGLKDLPANDEPLRHTHVTFGHCYKNQAGWDDFLRRFVEGNGSLLDLEFLVEANGRRVAAFGRSAGFCGMAIGLKQWCQNQLTGTVLGSVSDYSQSETLIGEIRADLAKIQQSTGKSPRIMVLGALGRCGTGAVQFAERAGIPSANIVRWDLEETKKGGPFDEILDVDIFVNCILLTTAIPPFLTREQLDRPRRLSIMVDVSCDPTNPYNPVPVYTGGSSFKKPTLRIIEDPVFDVISIDHLPSLLPLESSEEFSALLLPHLEQIGRTPVWDRAQQLFVQKSQPLRQ
eukprot:TRINITY_DN5542_c0_g1_i1.p1 TRINITY_DN5542_c0_g1~~TRINITY_DN5542_c0_g1_i1.p1  ORF type:complete len:370 (+),score=94.86 TRINITY_DN5542_c0_g1_i1:1338-2447(+)